MNVVRVRGLSMRKIMLVLDYGNHFGEHAASHTI